MADEKIELDEIKRLVKDPKLVMGTQNTIKKLKSNKLEKVWLAANAQNSVKEDIMNYSKMNNIPVIALATLNSDLGVLCKKQFAVSVVSLLKGEK